MVFFDFRSEITDALHSLLVCLVKQKLSAEPTSWLNNKNMMPQKAGKVEKGSRRTVMFKYKFVFTTILTSRNEITKMK